LKELLLDAAPLHTREQLHDAFRTLFAFPDWYGRNLDALYDLLTACRDTRLTVRHTEQLMVNLGRYGELLLRVLSNAAEDNPSFWFSTE